jgi:hypothetical protein
VLTLHRTPFASAVVSHLLCLLYMVARVFVKVIETNKLKTADL